MIIKRIDIQNFQCYYGNDNSFEFANGLNVILGDNGEGKTKFFEAVEWLLKGDKNFSAKISKKALAEASPEEPFEVNVTMVVEQYKNIKTVKRAFQVTKKNKEGDITVTDFGIRGIEENEEGEREPVDGTRLLDIIFPPEIRRYSLFKGEAELNIFDNRDALNNLINSFSSAKHYQKYVDLGKYLKGKAEKAVDRETKNDDKKKIEYNLLGAGITGRETELRNNQEKIDLFEEQLRKTDQEIKEVEKFVDNAASLETINERIEKIEKKIAREESRIKENYTTYLFDEKWILADFESIHRQFADKVEALDNNRRKLQKKFYVEEGKRKGKEELVNDMLHGRVPLPSYVPSKPIMEEMIKEEYCKVCNRPAEEGSDAYKYMQKRLQEYLEEQASENKEAPKKKKLFTRNYTKALFKMSARHEDSLSEITDIKDDITNLLSFNVNRKHQIKELEEQLEVEKKNREKIIGSSSIGEKKLTSILKNYTDWQGNLTSVTKRLLKLKQDNKRIKEELDEKIRLKEAIDMASASSFLLNTREVLRDVEAIFSETKEAKYLEFIEKLEQKSNLVFQQINVDDFTGNIKLRKKTIGGKPEISIELREKDSIFHNPNQSLETSMHMAILFAISELASELKEESFPMIFDAPTSSFGETKTKDFLNLIYETNKQRIILFYDFLGKDEHGNLDIKPEFEDVKRHKAFWIRRQRPFDKTDLSTINTQVISNI